MTTKLEALLNRFNEQGEEINYNSETGEVSIKKPSEPMRIIGHIIQKNNKLIYRKKEHEKDILRKVKGWSINRTVLYAVDEVEYITNEIIYRIDRSTALAHGKVRKFNSSGLDDKVVVGLEHWEQSFADKLKQAVCGLLGQSWGQLLYKEFAKEYMKELSAKIQNARKTGNVFPSQKDVFNAFRLTSYEDTKVVILGDEPLIDSGANGLAFSSTADYPPRIVTEIFKEVEADVYAGFYLNQDYDLTGWAEQGVLLLNIALTVGSRPGSHTNWGWETFNNEVLQLLFKKKHLVYLLWGQVAQNFFFNRVSNEVVSNNLILKTPDEIPIDGSSIFSGCKHFSQTNGYLKNKGTENIKW